MNYLQAFFKDFAKSSFVYDFFSKDCFCKYANLLEYINKWVYQKLMAPSPRASGFFISKKYFWSKN